MTPTEGRLFQKDIHGRNNQGTDSSKSDFAANSYDLRI